MENKQVQFSILCPTYNRSKLLRRAVESVLKQRFEDFELIVVNDGSTDETREVMESFSDNRIVYVEHERNKGINAARNTGYNLARGHYIALLDDDDELAPYALQLALDTFKRVDDQKVKVLFFNCLDVEMTQVSGKLLPEPTIITYVDLLSQKLKGDYWIVVERSIMPAEKVFDEGSGGAGYTWLRLLQSTDAYYSNKVAYFAYRRHNFARITNSRSWQKMEFNAQKLIDEFGEDMKMYCPDIYSKQIAVLAFYQALNKKIPQARANLFLSLRTRLSPYAVVLLFFTFVSSGSLLLVYRAVQKHFDTVHF